MTEKETTKQKIERLIKPGNLIYTSRKCWLRWHPETDKLKTLFDAEILKCERAKPEKFAIVMSEPQFFKAPKLAGSGSPLAVHFLLLVKTKVCYTSMWVNDFHLYISETEFLEPWFIE